MSRKNFKKLSTAVRRDPERAARVEEHKKAIRGSLGRGVGNKAGHQSGYQFESSEPN